MLNNWDRANVNRDMFSHAHLQDIHIFQTTKANEELEHDLARLKSNGDCRSSHWLSLTITKLKLHSNNHGTLIGESIRFVNVANLLIKLVEDAVNQNN